MKWGRVSWTAGLYAGPARLRVCSAGKWAMMVDLVQRRMNEVIPWSNGTYEGGNVGTSMTNRRGKTWADKSGLVKI